MPSMLSSPPNSADNVTDLPSTLTLTDGSGGDRSFPDTPLSSHPAKEHANATATAAVRKNLILPSPSESIDFTIGADGPQITSRASTL